MEFITKLCANCSGPHEREGELCSPCFYLRFSGRFKTRLWGDNQGLMNRRWQMRFNNRYLEPVSHSDLPLWETKRKEQSW